MRNFKVLIFVQIGVNTFFASDFVFVFVFNVFNV